MNRRRVTLTLVAVLAVVDVVGAAWLHEAWNDRRNKSGSVVAPAVVDTPASPAPMGKATAMRAGT